MRMNGLTYKYGDMMHEWNRPRTTFIVDSDARRGTLERLAWRHREIRDLLDEYLKLGVKVGLCATYTPKVLYERGIGVGVGPPMSWFGFFRSDTLQHIGGAVESLKTMADDEPCTIYNVEFPGIGRFAHVHIEDKLKRLPSNVHVWKPSYLEPRTPVVIDEDDEFDIEIAEDDDETEADS